jgi:uncharacterized protein YgiM (DUF1202 family)
LCIVDLPRVRDAARAGRRSGNRLALAAYCILLTACTSQRPAAPSYGVAYAGPTQLNLRKDLASKSGAVATVKHGEKLDVLETRRRFVRVRTSAGVEGWTDFNLLLTSQQMDDLKKLADSAAKLPSQGVATVFDALNMHAEPSRQSPSFFQIPEGGAVEVIGHRIGPRSAPAPVAAPPVRRVPPAAKKSKKEAKRSGPVPPMPTPPSPPPNWQELERPHAADLPGYRAPEVKPVSYDDWSLVRSKDGKVGWVLSRMLNMSIPDEVAQYAEGRRITSYLPLGDVKDKEKGTTQHNWLWTTISSGQYPYEFDNFRVFVWSIKRHRYETAYIERNVEGYYPVQTQDLPGQDEKAFTVVLRDKDGKLYKKTYAFSGYRVRMVSKAPYEPPAPLPEVRASRSFEPTAQSAPAEAGWKQKLTDWRKRLFKR